MSRSYKKHPIRKDNVKGMKTIAARKLRRKGLEEIPNGKAYRKLFDPWSISDWSIRRTLNEELAFHRDLENRELTDEEIAKIKNDWERLFKRK